MSAAYVIAAASQHPGDVRVQRVAKLRDKQWQLTVLQGTRAAGMNELQLGKALSKACDEQQRERMLQQLMQQVPGPLAASAAPGGAATVSAGELPDPPACSVDMETHAVWPPERDCRPPDALGSHRYRRSCHGATGRLPPPPHGEGRRAIAS